MSATSGALLINGQTVTSMMVAVRPIKTGQPTTAEGYQAVINREKLALTMAI